MSALSNIQLKCMITCDPLMKDKIIGVYSADQIKTLDVQKGLIVNTKPSGHEGEHWLAVYNNGGCVEIFDSLGIMSDKSLIDFYKFESTLRFNIKRIQCVNSFVCGHYSVFYLFLKVRGIAFNDFLHFCSPSCEQSDDYVYRFINRTFPLCLTNHM